MSINETLNYLKAHQKDQLLLFSAAVGTSSQYLKGSGGEAGDGFPMPADGSLIQLSVWDGANLKSAIGNVEIKAGERLSLWAEYSNGKIEVVARIDGVDTDLKASGLDANATLMAALLLVLGL